ncbi:type II toxin-antitoxin system RelE/ParE family toxin [Xanthobacteraceae bacterium A53D]
MKLTITAAALSDLRQIASYIAADNPRRSVSFIQEITQRLNSLRKAPHAFPLVPRFERLGIRRCVHGNYLIFYRVTDEMLIVLHVLHAARDYEPLLSIH